jgi:hypothetical protein
VNIFQAFEAWSEWNRTLRLWGLRPDHRAKVDRGTAEENNAQLAREREKLMNPRRPLTASR